MIRAFHPHPPTKTIKVEHDVNYITALDLAVLLSNDGNVGAVEVVEDGAAVGRIVFEMKEDYLKGDSHANGVAKAEEFMEGLKYTVVLSGIFWVMSMLTYLGGRW